MSESTPLGWQTLESDGLDQRDGMRAFAVLLGALVFCSLVLAMVQFAVNKQAPAISQIFLEHILVLIGVGGVYRFSEERLESIRLAVGAVAVLGTIALISTHYTSYNTPDLVAVRPRWGTFLVIAYAILVPASWRYHLGVAAASVFVQPLVVGAEVMLGVLVVDAGLWRGLLLDAVPATIGAVVATVLAARQYRLNQAVKDSARRLGNYTLTQKLGEGGMGEVWKAEHKFLGRETAVKLIRSHRLFGEGVDDRKRHVAFARFEREAQLTAALTSPHTVRLFDYGLEDDTIYYAMELLEGVDLDDLVLVTGGLPQERVHFFLLQMCDSLGEAHKHGLVHRDIKPANVFVSRQGLHFDFIKILDFGLAIEQQNYESGERLTMEGKITGSPMTMAPEQAFGEPVDARADIYSIGCVAYFALTGDSVFKGVTAREVLKKHVKAKPQPIREYVEDIDEGLEAIVMMCLEKKPEDRPQSVTQLYKMLQLCEFDRPWTEGRARRWYRSVGMFEDSLDVYAPDEPTPKLAMTGLTDE